MPGFLKRKKQVLVEPHRVMVPKLTQSQVRKLAIQEGINAVKKCHPGMTLGEIMQIDMNTALSKGGNMKLKKEIWKAFSKAANEFSKKHGGEELF